MESVIQMAYERETRNYWVYVAAKPSINKLYLTKGEGTPPATIEVQINVQEN